MTRRFTRLMICLFMAALPLQGIAAVLQTFCGPAHHSVMQSAAAHDHGASDAAHETHGHAHAQHFSPDANPEFRLAESFSDDGTSPVPASAYCSACASCCVGAVAPPHALLSPAQWGESSLVILPASPVLSGIIPAGLERPPKILA